MIATKLLSIAMLMPALAQEQQQGKQKPELGEFMKNFQTVTGRSDNKVVGSKLRISGGSEVRPKDKYPFMAFIRLDGYSDEEYMCGGTLLDRNIMLTSAHCVTEDYTRYFTAHVRRHNKKLQASQEGGSIHRFKKVVTHQDYRVNPNSSSNNDIALVRLSSSAPDMKFVRLPSTRMGDPPSDVELSITGWGLTSSKGPQSNILQEATKLHTTDTCFTPRSGLNRDEHLCAKGALSADACANDSGGPLLAPATDGGFIQVGIISSSNKCGLVNGPGVYTRILGQLDWIDSTRKSL